MPGLQGDGPDDEEPPRNPGRRGETIPSMIRLCTVALADAHLVEAPLEQAHVGYRVENGVVLVEEQDQDRAVAALRRYGRFEGVNS
ncbi:MAG: hypothetical protein WC277_02010 [Bacilli bacterium]